MCRVPPLCGGQEDEAAAARTGLRFHRRDECLADSAVTEVLVNDDCAQFRGKVVVLDGEADMDTCESHDRSVDLCDDKAIRFARRQQIYASGDGLSRGWIAKLLDEPSEGWRIFDTRVSDNQIQRPEA
jgi:hypothetical protein